MFCWMSGVDLSSSFLVLKISYFKVKTQATFPASQCQQTTEFQFAFEKKRKFKKVKKWKEWLLSFQLEKKFLWKSELLRSISRRMVHFGKDLLSYFFENWNWKKVGRRNKSNFVQNAKSFKLEPRSYSTLSAHYVIDNFLVFLY